MENIRVIRTNGSNKDFNLLIHLLDEELWNELNEDQATYDPHNKVPHVNTAMVMYLDNEPVACGCLREYDQRTTEIKRMFVKKVHRGTGLSKRILEELEQWALELGYRESILETSVHFNIAIHLYRTAGYSIIPNYGPYKGLKDSVCMKKNLTVV